MWIILYFQCADKIKSVFANRYAQKEQVSKFMATDCEDVLGAISSYSFEISFVK